MSRTIEWLNANRYRRYPFTDDADTGLAVYGDPGDCAVASLPNDAVLDFQATVTSGAYVPGAWKLASITLAAGGTIATFLFMAGNVSIGVEVPAAAAFPYTVRGSVTGAHYVAVFGPGAAALCCDSAFRYDCDIPLQPALLIDQCRHRVDTVAGVGQAVSGKVYLEPGYNCDPVVMAGRIRLTAGKGWGAGRYCLSLSDDVISCHEALLRLNGQTASDDGNVNISVIGASVGPDPARANTVLIKTTKMVSNMKCG